MKNVLKQQESYVKCVKDAIEKSQISSESEAGFKDFVALHHKTEHTLLCALTISLFCIDLKEEGAYALQKATMHLLFYTRSGHLAILFT